MDSSQAPIVSVDNFIENLKELVAGKKEFKALFITYNEVSGYDNGVAFYGNGLKIFVYNGLLEYDPVALGVALAAGEMGDLKLGGLAIEACNEEARRAQDLVEKGIPEELKTGKYLTVIYAGLSAFQESVEFARKLRESNPEATVVILTCDCKLDSKCRDLAPLVPEKIFRVVTTPYCGGRGEMADILKGLIRAWIDRRAD